MGSILLKPFALPLSWLYGAAGAANRKAYRSGFLKARRLPRPVISVGNLAIGGGGKTPIAIQIARDLIEQGVRVAVLSRGYGRRGAGDTLIISRGKGPVVPVERAGDEPFLIASRVPGAWVAVSPKRYEAGQAVLRETKVDLFLLDDGFSHYALARDLDIVTVDARRLFGDGRLFPAGILREPLSRLKNADILAVTKTSEVDTAFEEIARRLTDGPVVWSDYLPDHLVALADSTRELPLSNLRNRKVYLFSGIADPLSFEATAQPLCGEVVGRLRFRDHHPFTPADIQQLEQRARAKGAEVLLTTEKDLARLPQRRQPGLLCCGLAMGISFLQGEKVLRKRILALLPKEEKRGG